jgi:hypothetical protein
MKKFDKLKTMKSNLNFNDSTTPAFIRLCPGHRLIHATPPTSVGKPVQEGSFEDFIQQHFSSLPLKTSI